MQTGSDLPRGHVVQHGLALREGGVVSPHKGRAPGPLGRALPVLLERLCDRLCQPIPEPLNAGLRAPRVLLLDQHALLWPHKLCGSAAVAADGGRAAGHALDEDHAEGLLVRGKHAHLRHGEELGKHVLALGAHKERPLQAKLLCKSLILVDVSLRPAANNNCPQVRESLFVGCSRVENRVQALPISKLPDKCNHFLDAGQLALVSIAHMLFQVFGNSGTLRTKDVSVDPDARENELALGV
mmetsp:Transcript_54659/g.155545  ORF Transcript_54659/g.155545 Transcript_54659/m.155545 type:complete len:241 (+) Transcript_54659:250-972(+)